MGDRNAESDQREVEALETLIGLYEAKSDMLKAEKNNWASASGERKQVVLRQAEVEAHLANFNVLLLRLTFPPSIATPEEIGSWN